MNLTPASQALFEAIARNLGNWSGTPPCYDHITKENRGNLTQLKRAGLVTTFRSDGEEWIDMTNAGLAKATAAGFTTWTRGSR